MNFNREIDIDCWEHLWKVSSKMATCYQVKENIFKIHTRWYITPEKLNRMDPKISKTCWKCHGNEGTLYHIWWGCNKAKIYWKMIHKAIVQILGYEINKLPELYLLGLRLEEIQKKDRTLVLYLLAAARILYAKYWESTEIPDIYEWKAKIIYMCEMDKLTKRLRDCLREEYRNEWVKWLKYCGKDNDFQKFNLNFDIY